ncbi:hypothetical protein ABZ371_18740 [Streptomyces sp. NPDC005899]|uniref:hypothetical protein n=1 Tax=Streptomyces sp. NPDC005899 TaxID=3155716 RepID=UPI003404B51E
MDKYIKENNVRIGMIWLDVEGPGSYWGSSTSCNASTIQACMDGCKVAGHSVGVHTSESQWVPICGGYTGASDLPLWYAHHDDVQSCAGFATFDEWTRPTLKQYSGTVA